MTKEEEDKIWEAIMEDMQLSLYRYMIFGKSETDNDLCDKNEKTDSR